MRANENTEETLPTQNGRQEIVMLADARQTLDRHTIDTTIDTTMDTGKTQYIKSRAFAAKELILSRSYFFQAHAPE